MHIQFIQAMIWNLLSMPKARISPFGRLARRQSGCICMPTGITETPMKQSRWQKMRQQECGARLSRRSYMANFIRSK